MKCSRGINRVFALKKITRNSSIMLEKCQIHSGMLLVVFAVNESQKRRTRPTYHRRGAGRQRQFLNLFRHSAVAPRLHRQTAAQQQQRSSSTAVTAAAAAEGTGAGAEVAVAMAQPDELRHRSSARPGSIITITTTEQPVFYQLFKKQTQETLTAAAAQ